MFAEGTAVTVNGLDSYKESMRPSLPCSGIVKHVLFSPCPSYHVEVADGKQFEVYPEDLEEAT